MPTDVTSPPGVAHYTDLLLMPVRLAEKDRYKRPHSSQAVTLERMAQWVEGGGVWRRVRDAAIGAVGLDGKALGQGGQRPFDRMHQYQALAYFHPVVRRFLWGSLAVARASDQKEPNPQEPNDYMRCYRRNDIKAVKVCVWNSVAEESQVHGFDVVRCDLALFQPDVAVLQLELRAQTTADAPWSLADVQRVRDELRRLFAPYLTDWPPSLGQRGGHCPLSVYWGRDVVGDGKLQWEGGSLRNANMEQHWQEAFGQGQSALPGDAEVMPMFAHWKAWLGLGDSPVWDILPPGDDRLPSLAYVAVEEPKAIGRGDWVRLALADAPGGDQLPYAKHALEKFEERWCYDQFWYKGLGVDSGDSPSRIMNCGYAFTMVGSAHDTFFFMNPTDGAFVAFRQIYARLGLVAHFQKAALLGMLSRLSALAWRKSDGSLEDYDRVQPQIRQLYAEFLEFTQVYWFDEVSPQEQGRVLFGMWQRELGSPGLYEEVRQELKDLVEYVNAESAKRQAEFAMRQAESAERFTRTAAVLGGIGVVAGVLGMNILPLNNGALVADLSWQWGVFGLCAVVIVVTMAAGLLAYYWKNLTEWLHRKKGR